MPNPSKWFPPKKDYSNKSQIHGDRNPQCIDIILLIPRIIVNCHFGKKMPDISIPQGGIFVTYVFSSRGNCESTVKLSAASCQSSKSWYNNPTVLRQHRTMGAAGYGGSFAPIVQYEKWKIHKVFPHFPYFRLGQNLAPNLLAPLCGIALY